MNRYEGQNVDEYLKERGIFEEVDSLTQQELETLRDQDAPEIIETPPSYVGRFYNGSGLLSMFRDTPVGLN